MSEKERKIYELYKPEQIVPSERGVDLLNDARYNKGMAFTLSERQALGIHGLIPPAFMTEEQQEYRVMSKLRAQPDDLARYIQLDSLQDRDEKLFYRVFCANIEELMPVVYTPTVGLACRNFGYIYRKPKGVYVTINDNSISKIHHILNNWPENNVRVIVVTDGERISGIGDLGCYGIGVPVGKLALYVALGGFQPQWCLPVQLDVGTDNEELLKDPFYIGLRRKRVRGEEYDMLIDNFLKACTKKFGYHTLVHFEDFSDKHAYQLLQRYNDKYTVFNDEIEGTPAAVLAGILASSRITNMKPSHQKFIIFGSNAKAAGTAELLKKQMVLEGISEEEACSRIYVMSPEQELLVKQNTDKFLDHLVPFAKGCEPINNLLQLVEEVKPSGLIGASEKAGVFDENVVGALCKATARPLIFALSAEPDGAECSPQDAYHYSNGNVLYAGGLRTRRLTLEGKTLRPGLVSNAYIYPGVALGAILFRVRHIDDSLFLVAAKKVAGCVTESDLRMGHLYPRLKRAREIAVQIAIEIAKHCYENETATLIPQPEDLEQFIRAHLYNTSYETLTTDTYKWPEHDMKHGFPVPFVRRESVDE